MPWPILTFMEDNLLSNGTVSMYIPSHSHEGVYMKPIYSGEACEILGIEIRTFNKYVKEGMIKVIDHDPHGHRLFDEPSIRKLLKRRIKKRAPGKRLFI